MSDAATLAALCARCEVIVSVCPPDQAERVAQEVAAQRFSGLYLDANAVSPARAERIGALVTRAGARFVDGGIIGGPAWQARRTWLYLSGEEAERAAALFASGPLETRVLGAEIGRASALKMCFAAYSKGTTALLGAVLGAAEALGVRGELETQWARHDPAFAAEAAAKTRKVTAKAWRFAGEMDEIAATFRAAGLPGGFHESAAEVYRRLAGFKEAPTGPALDPELGPALDEVLDALRRPEGG